MGCEVYVVIFGVEAVGYVRGGYVLESVVIMVVFREVGIRMRIMG